MKSTLLADSISHSYVDSGVITEVLNNITIGFQQGDTYAIKGVSGSGKSTLLHILGGLDKPEGGKVLLGEDLVGEFTERERSVALGFVFQFHYLINELTVLENVMLVGKLLGMVDKDVKKRSLELINFLGLQNRIHYSPYKLSGGEQQRVSIARALFNKPKFLLADEPTGNLDKKNAEQVVDLLLQCCEEWNMGLVICTHDEYVCNRMKNVLLLSNGLLNSCKTD